jgi:glycosyltransferase involved in cell wall biosynthesis
MIRLAIVSTHPVQYYAPLFRRLSEFEDLKVRVFYGWKTGTEGKYDPGFDRDVQWDIPLLQGYNHTFVKNESSDPGTHHFRGLVNPSLPAKIEGWNADAVLVFGWAWQSHLRTIFHFSGRRPVLFRGDSTLIDEAPGIRQIVRRLCLRSVYHFIDHAFYVGSLNRAYFQAHGLTNDQLHWVPHAVENSRFTDPDGRTENRAMEWLQELSIPLESTVFLFAGKLSAKKGIDLLLQAFEQLDTPEAHLVVVGSGPLEDYLRRNLTNRIHFLGFQNQSKMPTVYKLCDVFVIPSRGPGETWGLAVNEAMASGKAVVASARVGCSPDLVNDGKNGFTFTSESVEELTDRLAQFTHDSTLADKMGQASQEIINCWSIEKAANLTLNYLRAIL